MSTKPEPILKVDLGKNGGKVTFHNLDEIDAWIARENNFWTWYGSCSGQDNNTSQVWSRLSNPINNLRTNLASARQHQNNPDFGGYLRNIESQMNQAYGQSSTIHSSTPIAKFVDKLRQENQNKAAYALCHLMGYGFNPNIRAATEGVFEALLFEKKIQGNTEAETTALLELRQSWDAYLEQYKGEADALQKEFATLAGSMSEAHQSRQEEHRVLIEEHKTKFDQTLADAKAKLDDIAKAYDVKMAMQAPVTYWEEQQVKHAGKSKFFAKAAGWFGFIAAVVLILLARWLLSEEIIQAPKSPYVISIAKIPTWHLGLLLTIGVFSIWVERILVRMLLSEVHLATDAGERVVMAKTYIALLRDDKGPKDEDRQLILQTLFRPSATGIVKDDGLPPNALEWLTRIKTG